MVRKRLSLAALAAGAGNGPSSVAIGDLNGDAMPDLTVDNRVWAKTQAGPHVTQAQAQGEGEVRNA